MAVFACAGCSAVLTVPVSRVELPDHVHQQYGYGLLPAAMEPGTYAVDPHPGGPPWLAWEEVGKAGAAARGWHARRDVVSDGPRGRIVLAPGDVRGTVPVPEWDDGHCCGLAGMNGPNMMCGRCGLAVATRIDDCGLWQAVWLEPQAVRRVDDGAERPVAGWAELLEDPPWIPPVEESGRWSPRWAASAAVALAHLLAASGGAGVALPRGRLFSLTLGRAVREPVPAGSPAKTLAPAGPGLPDAHADIVMVPRHPQTGEPWARAAGTIVPLAAGVWFPLAFPRERRPAPRATDGEAAGDFMEGATMPPDRTFRPDGKVFLQTLARLPAVREPWLRAIERCRSAPWSAPFQ